ncbi:DUF3375 domain-containing protein [Sanguibacter antarcticus]|uniref:Uncharacterized protein DUF3375 n=1 Tax=Sanguibacter antarcticus TaxID=372484 RepID=A0A2A9E8I8_9MICO|nr:DUF3375 domain-containing protein [Sanguibacter antarcticus]PFG34480.1 uncharacterized protein DUF3375 [Sanguibacter antarcticus]
MNHDDVEALRRDSAAWRLLRADNAALVLTFLGRVFIEQNIRSIGETELVSLLDDELYALNTDADTPLYPRHPKAYLDAWAHRDAGWLRKYYRPGTDEPHYDATPAVEKAVGWVASLAGRSFVGTESRLNTVFDLLRQLAHGTESDPAVRLAELEARRAQIDAEIAQVRDGRVTVLDPASQRDRYQQFAAMAAELLSDFREVEANFRALDRDMRERITGWDGSKGELLEQVVGSRTSIADSDQGRSFHAFYDFLLSRERQEEFTDLVAKVQSLDAISAVAAPGATGGPDRRLRRIHYDWLDAGEQTQATVRVLSEHLRRFLDDQVWAENRRVMDILRSIESRALAVRDHVPPPGTDVDVALATEIDGVDLDIVLPMERPLFRPHTIERIDSEHVEPGAVDFDTSLLFEQVHVDPERLARGVRERLQHEGQVSLVEVVADRPLEQGLAELVTYLSLEDPRFDVVLDAERTDEVRWTTDGTERVATVPRITFARAGSAPALAAPDTDPDTDPDPQEER